MNIPLATTIYERRPPGYPVTYTGKVLDVDLRPLTPTEHAIGSISTADNGHSIDLERLVPGKSRGGPTGQITGPYSQSELRAIAKNLGLKRSGLKRELTTAIRELVYG